MHSIRRGCSAALKTTSRPAYALNCPHRAFSQCSPLRKGSLPSFLEPSSEDLGAALAKLNSKVLLPAQLSPDQRKLVFRPSNTARLEAESVEITLGDVTLPLEHINQRTDTPSRWGTIKTIVDSSETPEDWENVLRMLEGFEDASLHLSPARKCMIIRSLNNAGMQHLVLKALQRADKTGLRLRDEEIVLRVFTGFHEKALDAEWGAAETKKALGYAEQVIDLMEEKTHLGGKPVGPGDLRSNPVVIGALLELAAVRAKKHTEGKDVDGKVKKYAHRIMSAHTQDPSIMETHLSRARASIALNKFKSNHVKASTLNALKSEIISLIPLYIGIKTASQVLGADMPLAREAQTLAKTLLDTFTDAEKKLLGEEKKGFVITLDQFTSELKAAREV
ncbi:hypothetical protein BU24DRAFT_446444 [Aaosphaeria arxii CBS 175.79]|uniref:Uncharacterized protein n=1 Tax=Aaosphaeria arxii CBS 175.79 TaxID=1450172 RepID=A0A6A5Y8T8_9PLEO|nr:uncharacterized protein BU24DRAFT_446444 [Aaosphaeria arxii CBS 175.79]KAF2021427.1 hypothetical protein BU24DRAFT_446444 [Aaosphaeria arxii CBS 175.79]